MTTIQPFNAVKIGQRIAQYRKQQNLTQSELAQALGVSFQAVSSWENGNTCPDIGKLASLGQLLNISIDVLLDNPFLAKAVDKVENQRDLAPEELVAIAPITPPHDVNDLFAAVDLDFSLKDLVGIAPYVGESFIDQWLNTQGSAYSLDQYSPLLPYLEDKSILTLIEKARDIDLRKCITLAPYLEEDAMKLLLQRSTSQGNSDDRALLAYLPYLEDDMVDQLVSEGHFANPSEWQKVLPYLSDESLHRLVENGIANGSLNDADIQMMAPFLDDEDLRLIVRNHGSMTADKIVALVPYLDETDLDELVRELLADPDLDGHTFVKLVPFCDERTVNLIIKTYMERNRIKEVLELFPFADL